MVAPVVLITLATIFANGLLTAGSSIASRISALNQECLVILSGPHGELLHHDILRPVERERLTQIREQMPVLIRRGRRIHNAILTIWISIGLLVLSVGAVAVAVTAHSEGFAFTALALVLSGVAGVFIGIATVIIPLASSTDPVIEEAERTGALG